MEKITQKQTKDILTQKENYLIHAGYHNIKNYNDIMQGIHLQNGIDTQNVDASIFRKSEEVKTNYIKFTDGSRIYFDNIAIKKDYYLNDNLLTIIELYEGEQFLAMQYLIK